MKQIFLVFIVISGALILWSCNKSEEPKLKYNEIDDKESININVGSKQKKLIFNFDEVKTTTGKDLEQLYYNFQIENRRY